jgi:hypothetical protein
MVAARFVDPGVAARRVSPAGIFTALPRRGARHQSCEILEQVGLAVPVHEDLGG